MVVALWHCDEEHLGLILLPSKHREDLLQKFKKKEWKKNYNFSFNRLKKKSFEAKVAASLAVHLLRLGKLCKMYCLGPVYYY